MPQKSEKHSKRRSAGEGSWREIERTLPNGTSKKMWCYAVSIGYDRLTGKRVRRYFYGATKSEVRLKYDRAKCQQGGTVRQSDSQSVGRYLNAWLLAVGAAKCAPTLRFYEQRIRRYAIPETGPSIARLRLDEITNSDIAELYRALYDKGVSADNVAKLHRGLRRAFNVAIGKSLMRANPCAFVERKPHKTQKRVALSAKQVSEFLKKIQGVKNEAFFITGIFCAMRPGELFALAWADVDLEEKVIHIRHSLQENPRLIVNAKADSARTIPLSPYMVDVLRRHHDMMMARKEKYRSPYVFTNRLGQWLGPKTMNTELQDICADAGLPRLTLYNLRHTGVSLLGEARVPIRVISDLAGHVDSSITLDIYSHSTAQMLREGVELAVQIVERESLVSITE